MESGAWLVPEPSADPRMTTDTLTITDFILARVAEDEAVAEQVSNWDSHLAHELDGFSANAQRFARHVTPARILAQCKATRAVVESHDGGYIKNVGPLTHECDGSYDSIVCETLTALAAVYVGHEDYRAEWSS